MEIWLWWLGILLFGVSVSYWNLGIHCTSEWMRNITRTRKWRGVVSSAKNRKTNRECRSEFFLRKHSHALETFPNGHARIKYAAFVVMAIAQFFPHPSFPQSALLVAMIYIELVGGSKLISNGKVNRTRNTCKFMFCSPYSAPPASHTHLEQQILAASEVFRF